MCYYENMIFPYEHADKILFFNRTARNPRYLVGSPQYKLIEYNIPDLNIHILCERGYTVIEAPAWQVLFTAIYDYKQFNSYFNTKVLRMNDTDIMPGGYNYTVEYSGSLEKCLEDVTFLWFQHS